MSPISISIYLATVEEGLSIGSERDSGYVTRSFALPHCRDQLAQTQQIPVLTVLSSRTGNSLGSVLQSEEREERERERERRDERDTMPDPRATSQFCAFYSFTGILFMVRVFSLVSWNISFG